eukprot:868400-Pelagomonas_calceolata.AAC.1
MLCIDHDPRLRACCDVQIPRHMTLPSDELDPLTLNLGAPLESCSCPSDSHAAALAGAGGGGGYIQGAGGGDSMVCNDCDGGIAAADAGVGAHNNGSNAGSADPSDCHCGRGDILEGCSGSRGGSNGSGGSSSGKDSDNKCHTARQSKGVNLAKGLGLMRSSSSSLNLKDGVHGTGGDAAMFRWVGCYCYILHTRKVLPWPSGSVVILALCIQEWCCHGQVGRLLFLHNAYKNGAATARWVGCYFYIMRTRMVLPRPGGLSVGRKGRALQRCREVHTGLHSGKCFNCDARQCKAYVMAVCMSLEIEVMSSL